MYSLLQRRFDYMSEMAALGAIGIEVISFIPIFSDCPVEKVFDAPDLVSYLWQIEQFKWSSVFFYQVFQRNAMESQVAITEVETLLRKVVGLIYEIEVIFLHYSGN